MAKITRFGVSLPKKLVDRFDETIESLGYKNRSKAIQDALTEFINQKRINTKDSKVTCTISYLYDHHTSGVNSKLTEIQHKHGLRIKSTMHAHLSHHQCVEVLIAEGKPLEIQKLYGNLSAIRGVQNCKIAVLDTAKTGT